MQQIYAKKLWGDNNSPFYSGEGSYDPNIVNPYITSVSSFLKSFKNPITVCDLGCGDFNIGKQLVQYTKKYIAIDIVPELIAHNKENFNARNLEFQCLDIAKDELPKTDCVLLRQVLQHLSNTEIKNIVLKLASFKYVILTEHLPEGYFKPNKDIISGQGIRLKKHSGIDLLMHPFNFKIKEKIFLSSITPKDFTGRIETVMYKI